MCTFKVHIKSARAHVHLYVHFESAHVHFKSAHVHFKDAHVHFQSANVHFLCSKSNSTSTPVLGLTRWEFASKPSERPTHIANAVTLNSTFCLP